MYIIYSISVDNRKKYRILAKKHETPALLAVNCLQNMVMKDNVVQVDINKQLH